MIRPPLAIIAAADVTSDMLATGWSSKTSPALILDTKNLTRQLQPGIGISVSEPLPGANYYKEPTVTRPKFDDEQAITDCYGSLLQTDDGSGNSFLDVPEDSDRSKDRLIKHMPSRQY